MPQTILIVDDEPDLREILRMELEKEGYQILEAGDGKQARQLVEGELPELVLLDLNLPDESGISILQWLREQYPDIESIVVSGTGSIGMAVQSVKLGAFDYLEKPVDSDRLQITVQNALQRARLSQNIVQLRQDFKKRSKTVGDSEALEEVFDLIERAAPTDASVLIRGESGVGKELVADAIQQASKRNKNPYVKVNCAAIPKDLIESELFGHVKGSFTGATDTKAGKFELADGGTLFLDEVGDMSLMTQAKVLRFLQNGETQRVGGTTTRKVDVRVIAATNKDLEEEIREKRFREDLLYRLNVISIDVPPLRERKEDIPALVAHFIEKHGINKGYGARGITSEALAHLGDYDWPGNIRELENMIERYVILSRSELIEEIVLPSSTSGVESGTALDERVPFSDRVNAFSRDILVAALEKHQWNRSAAAKELGLHRNTLLSKMEKLGIGKE